MRNYREIVAQVTALGSEFSNARSAAYKLNPDLRPEAHGRAVADRLEAAHAKYIKQFDALVERAHRERDAIVTRAAKARPTLDSSDVAAMVRTERAWSHDVRPALEQGRDLDAALTRAGLDEVLGAERFAASWLATHLRRDSTVDFRHMVAGTVAQALARFARNDADAAAILDGEAADREFEVVREVIGHAKAGRVLQAALALQYADLPQSLLVEQGAQVATARSWRPASRLMVGLPSGDAPLLRLREAARR